jgi:hypothetical protein
VRVVDVVVWGETTYYVVVVNQVGNNDNNNNNNNNNNNLVYNIIYPPFLSSTITSTQQLNTELESGETLLAIRSTDANTAGTTTAFQADRKDDKRKITIQAAFFITAAPISE